MTGATDAIVSVHDVMPASFSRESCGFWTFWTLPTYRHRPSSWCLGKSGRRSSSRLSVSLAEKGCPLAGHGWAHKATAGPSHPLPPRPLPPDLTKRGGAPFPATG
jgi:hypothetical protein